ncbi:MAG: zinc ribbon domain-containing protein, partial [Myxococcota bacterium]
MEAVESRSAVRACEHCRTDNPIDARFCKACGAALRAPPACPKCNAETSIDAKFCANCGAALIGPRPEPAIPAAVASSPPEEPADTHESDETDYRAMLQAEAAMLPAATRPAATNIMSNVLMFVAFLMVMVVVIYKMNQGAPKVRSPFEGGPPPSAARAQPASGEPSGSGTPAAAGAA